MCECCCVFVLAECKREETQADFCLQWLVFDEILEHL